MASPTFEPRMIFPAHTIEKVEGDQDRKFNILVTEDKIPIAAWEEDSDGYHFNTYDCDRNDWIGWNVDGPFSLLIPGELRNVMERSEELIREGRMTQEEVGALFLMRRDFLLEQAGKLFSYSGEDDEEKNLEKRALMYEECAGLMEKEAVLCLNPEINWLKAQRPLWYKALQEKAGHAPDRQVDGRR